MENNILNTILSHLKAMRNNLIFESELNLKKTFEINEFKVLDKEKRALIIEIGKLKFENKDTSEKEKKLIEIENKIDKVLLDNNIDKNSLSPNFKCKKCKDTGFVGSEYCSCLKQAYNNYIMRQSNIDFKEIPNLIDYPTSIFEKAEQQNISKIVENLKLLADNLLTAKTKNIVLVGKTGVGKTHLAKSFAKQVISKNHTVLFLSAFNLNNEFLKIHTNSETNKMNLLENLVNVDLLILDDLGTEPILKNVTKEYLLLLLNERILKGKTTLITTNLMPNNILDRYEERIYSRLNNKQDCALFLLGGKDLRIS